MDEEEEQVNKATRIFLTLATGAALTIASSAYAANPATISVTVTIENLSVAATGPIAFGTVTAGSQTVSTGASTVTNDGNVTETYSLDIADPAGWTGVQTVPGVEEYGLLAQFNSAAPTAASFTFAEHSMSSTSTAASASKFAGDETGLSVATSATRSLWFRFDAPSSTAVTTQQTITVTVTAAAG
jgi:hypothetical protein